MTPYELADAIEDWDSDGQWDTPAANMIRQQADRIAELEKELIGYKTAWNEAAKLSVDYIPSTVPQTKPLSDEEITNLSKRKANAILMDLLMPDVGEPKKIDWNIGCTREHLKNFARAIEERHGIK